LIFFWGTPIAKGRARRSISILLAFATAFLFFYLLAYFRFVRTIDIATRGTSVSVSVGYHRTEFAANTFGRATDWEILRQRGTDEEEIWMLWTVRSLLVARSALLLTYLGFILSLVAALSWGALHPSEHG
jgi:hypothetical protein